MLTALHLAAGLALFAAIAWATPRLLGLVADSLARDQASRRRRLDRLRAAPCTLWWQPHIPFLNNPQPRGRWAYAIRWAPRRASCKSPASGSPLH